MASPTHLHQFPPLIGFPVWTAILALIEWMGQIADSPWRGLPWPEGVFGKLGVAGAESAKPQFSASDCGVEDSATATQSTSQTRAEPVEGPGLVP